MSDEHELRRPSPSPGSAANDPHLQPSARNPGVGRARHLGLLHPRALCFAGFGACYWINAQPWKLGATIGGGFFFVGVGMVAWGKYLMPRGPFVEERHTLANSKADRDAFAAVIVERGGGVVQRRKMLGGLLGGGLGHLRPRRDVPAAAKPRTVAQRRRSTRTDWKKGSYVVDQSGRRVEVGDLAMGSIATVFPKGPQNTDRGQAVDQTVLIRVSNEGFTTMKGRETWAPHGYVAYSKVCTHLGCPVGLYEQQLQLLVCPCHQSMFNVTNGAVPAVRTGPTTVAPVAALHRLGGLLTFAERLPRGRRAWILGALVSDVINTKRSKQAGPRPLRSRRQDPGRVRRPPGRRARWAHLHGQDLPRPLVVHAR